MNQRMKKVAVMLAAAGLVLGLGAMANAAGKVTFTFAFNGITVSNTTQDSGAASLGLPSLPPFPGIESSDFGDADFGGADFALTLFGFGISMSPNGQTAVRLGQSLPLTISRIDMLNYTIVRVAEYVPGGYWTMLDASGWYPSGTASLTFYADTPGTHIIIAWVDNNHNGLVDYGELTSPWLQVQVQNQIRIHVGP